MKHKTGIVMATMIEAAPFISGLKLEEQTRRPFPLFSGNEFTLIISGIGKVYAALAAGILVREMGVKELHNAGAAGGLREGFSTGDILHVSEIIDFDRPKLVNKEIRRMKPDVFEGFRTATLATLDRPIIRHEDRCMVGQYADIIDMEGAGFLQACRTFGVKGYLWKMVSDTAEHEKDSEIIGNIRTLIAGLYDFMSLNVFRSSYE